MERLVPLSLLLLLLLFLVISTTSSAEVRLSPSSEVDGGDGPADDEAAPVCDIVFDPCKGSCWKSGKCLSCCLYHGFVHGKCRLFHGDGCYCCHSPEQKIGNGQMAHGPVNSPGPQPF